MVIFEINSNIHNIFKRNQKLQHAILKKNSLQKKQISRRDDTHKANYDDLE